MKKICFYVLVLIMFVKCRKESEDCHFFVTIKNNSEINISLLFSGSCGINRIKEDKASIPSKSNIKFRPYRYPECIENVVRLDKYMSIHLFETETYNDNVNTCEEFEERNTILRTYILTLEDLERLDYTINYPEDASIGVK